MRRDADHRIAAWEAKFNTQRVKEILYVPYLDYARELYHRKRKMEASGDSMVREAQVLLEKWQARTLDPVVLALIRTQVFDVAAPAGP